jgi:hypothetical protein
MGIDDTENSVEDNIEDIALTKKKMTKMVEEKVRTYGMSYTDSVLEICESRAIDPADISNMISPLVRDKIEAEAIDARMVRGSEAKLPV